MNDDIKWKIDAEIEKDKRVVELEWQNRELKQANDYLQEKLHEIKEPINHYHSECVELRRICNQLQSNWNSLREFLESMIRIYENEYKDVDTACHYKCVLDKMNELERKDKE